MKDQIYLSIETKKKRLENNNTIIISVSDHYIDGAFFFIEKELIIKELNQGHRVFTFPQLEEIIEATVQLKKDKRNLKESKNY